MKIKELQLLEADEGMILTDGEIYGEVIILGDGRVFDEFHEISKEEYEKITEEPKGEEDEQED